MSTQTRRRPGEIRDAIFSILFARPSGASVQTIERQVIELIGSAAGSSVRSYLRLNTPTVFVRTARAHYALRDMKSLVKRQPYTKQIAVIHSVDQPSFMLTV